MCYGKSNLSPFHFHCMNLINSFIFFFNKFTHVFIIFFFLDLLLVVFFSNFFNHSILSLFCKTETQQHSIYEDVGTLDLSCGIIVFGLAFFFSWSWYWISLLCCKHKADASLKQPTIKSDSSFRCYLSGQSPDI